MLTTTTDARKLGIHSVCFLAEVWDIPGRHVAEDGTVRDEDGYICVAASDLEYGSTVETSLGTGKVYDTGCAAGTTDVYVDW